MSNVEKKLNNLNQESVERPEASEEVQDDESKFDSLIESKEDAYYDIGKLLKEEVLEEGEDKEIINERKTREAPLIDKYDDFAYKEAGFLGRIKHRLGFGENLVRGRDKKILDKTKINDSAKDAQYEVTLEDKKQDLAKAEGIDDQEAKNLNYSEYFKEIEGNLTKFVTRDATENEKLSTAKELIKKRIDTWRDIQGVNLVKDKEKLGSYNKNSKELDNLLKSDMISESVKEELSEKRKEEIDGLEENIKLKEENLRSEINEFMNPLEDQRIETGEAIKEFSGALNKVSEKEKELAGKIKAGKQGLIKANKLSMPESVREGIIEEIKTQIEQARVNMEVYSEMKKDLSERLGVTKVYNKQVEKKLKELKTIGKTKQEIQEEKKKELEEKNKTETKTIEDNKNQKRIDADLYEDATEDDAEKAESLAAKKADGKQGEVKKEEKADVKSEDTKKESNEPADDKKEPVKDTVAKVESKKDMETKEQQKKLIEKEASWWVNRFNFDKVEKIKTYLQNKEGSFKGGAILKEHDKNDKRGGAVPRIVNFLIKEVPVFKGNENLAIREINKILKPFRK